MSEAHAVTRVILICVAFPATKTMVTFDFQAAAEGHTGAKVYDDVLPLRPHRCLRAMLSLCPY